MVEQAVQTGSLDNLNAKKLLPGGKGTVGVQLNGRPAPPSGKSASGTETLAPGMCSRFPPCTLLPGGFVKGIAPSPKYHMLFAGQALAACPLGWCHLLPSRLLLWQALALLSPFAP